MKIYGATSSPIPPSGITRISLWRHGMERPRIVNTVEFRHHTDMILDPNSRLYHDYKQNDEKVTCFNVATDNGLIRFGYLPSLKGAHSNILFPNIDENPFRGITESSISDNKKTWISLTPTLAGMNLDDEENISAFQGFVTISRFLIESSFSADTNLVGGTTNDLYFLNEASNNAFFRCQIKTLGDLARQALPQDADLNNVLSFPAPPVFEHCENHPDKKCSFGFNILHPAKFPYPAQAVSIAIRTFLGSRSWDPKKIDTVLEPLKLPSKDGERVIHITAKEISGSRTELSFCIRRPLEHESTAPIKGRIIFRE